LASIGTVSIEVSSPVVDGQEVTLTASHSGDAADVSYAWTPPAGSSLTPPAEGPAEWTFSFTAANDSGVYTVEAVDPAADDSPQYATAQVVSARLISRFGRTYAFYQPGGSGPATWILAGPGGLAEGSGGPASHATLAPDAPIFTQAGHAVRMLASGELQLARADSYENAVVVGLVISGSVPGEITSFTTDGQISRGDWTPIIGAPALVPGTRYFLSPTNLGRLVAQPPLRPHYLVPVGRAVSATTLEVELNLPVQA
jgi:hypothetical protein